MDLNTIGSSNSEQLKKGCECYTPIGGFINKNTIISMAQDQHVTINGKCIDKHNY